MQTEKVIEHIVNWLIDYKRKNTNVKGFVVGVSGGIDSAVVSTLCARTGAPLMALEIPILGTEPEFRRSRNHIEWLKKAYGANVQSQNINLQKIFHDFMNMLPVAQSRDLKELSQANFQARLRMITLYHFAQLNGYIVVGTGNKVEDFGVGFFTKYGDGGVDISPIADLLKTEVRMLAAALGISQEIIEAQSTDGLYEDSPGDEDQMGATYEEIEWAMKQKEAGKLNDSAWTAREKEVWKIVEKRYAANVHKMTPIPICKIPQDLKKS